MNLLAVLLFLLGFASTRALYIENRGDQIWRVLGEAGSILQGLEERGLVDILSHRRQECRVTRKDLLQVAAYFRENNISYEVVVSDVADHLEKVQRNDPRIGESCTESSCPRPLTNQYMTFEQMEWYLDHIKTYNSSVEVTSIGKSVEGRDIWMVRLKAVCGRAKSVWIEAGIHAREWISPAVAMNLIQKLLFQCSVRSQVDVYIVPMSNPDGYEFSRLRSRFWRKNRARNTGSSCLGVDLNRNWDYKWGVGASGRPCSSVYKGPKPFSEPETVALKTEMLKLSDLYMVMALHSYGQILLYPWGWSSVAEVPNLDELKRVGNIFKTHADIHNTIYRVENSASGLYLASGTTDDWALNKTSTKLSYALELRDEGEFGFLLPASQISPTAHEVFLGLRAILIDMVDVEANERLSESKDRIKV